MRSPKKILIAILILSLSSCVTSKKCNDKFPSKVLISDTLTTSKIEDILLGDILDSLEIADLSLETPKFDIRLIRDTVIVNTNDTLIITNTVKGGQQSIKCETVKLEYIIKGLNVKIRSYETLITNTEQLYVDAKAENKKLKLDIKKIDAENKVEVKRADSQKFKYLAKMLSWIALIIGLGAGIYGLSKINNKK